MGVPLNQRLVARKTGCPLSENLIIISSVTLSYSPCGLSSLIEDHFFSDLHGAEERQRMEWLPKNMRKNGRKTKQSSSPPTAQCQCCANYPRTGRTPRSNVLQLQEQPPRNDTSDATAHSKRDPSGTPWKPLASFADTSTSMSRGFALCRTVAPASRHTLAEALWKQPPGSSSGPDTPKLGRLMRNTK